MAEREEEALQEVHKQPQWPRCFQYPRFSRSELLMLDDLKPGYDMAKSCGVDFAAAGWSNDIPEIESFMRSNCDKYFKTVAGFSDFLEEI